MGNAVDLTNISQQFIVPIWKKYRRIISPVLHPGNVETFLPIFNDVSRHLVTNLNKSGKPVDPRREIFNASMDAVIGKISVKTFLVKGSVVLVLTIKHCRAH